MQRTWGPYLLETRTEYGYAAHGNRGRYSGTKVHELRVDYIVGLADPHAEAKSGTYGTRFKRTGQPVLFSCQPACGCTGGQNAGRPSPRLTAADVTCKNCGSHLLKQEVSK